MTAYQWWKRLNLPYKNTAKSQWIKTIRAIQKDARKKKGAGNDS